MLYEVITHLHEHDIVVSCTASSLPILGKGLVERALRARRRRPMFMVDLAVPRDIEPEVGDMDRITSYNVCYTKLLRRTLCSDECTIYFMRPNIT